MKTITIRNAYRFTLLCLVLLAGIAQAEIETITYLHSDHLGSPVLVRDNQGNTLWREDYSPWGERLTRPSGNSADIGYTGHYEETDIGLTYAQARWYDPQVGRFLAPDAVDFSSGGAAHFNRYVYANDNPLRFIDLDGRDSREAVFAALGDVDYNARGANAAQGVSNGAAVFGDAVDYAVEPSAASVLGGVFGKLGLRVLSGVGGKSARTPVGRSGQQNNFLNPNAPKPRNAPETINGRDYSGHAIDRMQERGYTPSVIESALQNGARSAGNKQNTSLFTDTANKLRVVTNSDTGSVITVIPGLK